MVLNADVGGRLVTVKLTDVYDNPVAGEAVVLSLEAGVATADAGFA